MSEAAVQVQGDEAKGVTGDEAMVNGTASVDAKGTPLKDANGTLAADSKTDDSAQTQGADDGVAKANADAEALNELRHSDATLAAEREVAIREGYDKARGEDTEKRQQRNQQIQRLIRAEEGDAPAVVRAVRNALGKLPALEEGESFSDADFEPVLKTVRDALGLAVDAGLTTVEEIYTGEINRLFENKVERDAFWEKANKLDPMMHVSDVLNLVIEERALSSKSVQNAESESLVTVNPKLKAHINRYGDERYKEGREQGRKDPAGDRSADAERRSVASPNGPKDKAEAEMMLSGVNQDGTPWRGTRITTEQFRNFVRTGSI